MSTSKHASPDLEEGEISETEANSLEDRPQDDGQRHSHSDHSRRPSTVDCDHDPEASSRNYASAKARKVIARSKRGSFKAVRPKSRTIEFRNRDRDRDRDRDDDRYAKDHREAYGTARSRRWQQERRSRPNLNHRHPRNPRRPSHDEGEAEGLSEEAYDYYRQNLPEDPQHDQNRQPYHEAQPTYPEPTFEQAPHQATSAPAPSSQHLNHPQAYPPNYPSYQPTQNPYEQTEPQPPHPPPSTYSHIPPNAQTTSDFDMSHHYPQHESQPPTSQSYYTTGPPVYDEQMMVIDSQQEQAPNNYYHPTEPSEQHNEPHNHHPEMSSQHLSHPSHLCHPPPQTHHQTQEISHESYHQHQHQPPPDLHSHQIMMEDACRHSQPPQLRQTTSHQENHLNQNCQEQQQQQQPIMEDDSVSRDYYQYHPPQEQYPQAPLRPHPVQPEFEYEAHHQNGFQSNGYQLAHQDPSSIPQNDQQVQYPHHDQMQVQYEESLGQYRPPAQPTCPPAGPYENYQANPTIIYPNEQPFMTFINLEGERHEVTGLISELVSWGVTAGYLIELGISKDLVFRTFEELGYRITQYTNYVETLNKGYTNVGVMEPKEPTNLRIHHTEDVDGVDGKSFRESSIGFLLDQHTPPSQSPVIPNEVIKEEVVQKPRSNKPETDKVAINLSIQPSLNILDDLVESEAVRKAQRQAFRLALSKKSAERVEKLKSELQLIFDGPLREEDGNRSSESNEENGLLSPIVSATTTIDSFIGPKEIEEEEEEERGGKKGKGKAKGKERWVEILKGDDLFSKIELDSRILVNGDHHHHHHHHHQIHNDSLEESLLIKGNRNGIGLVEKKRFVATVKRKKEEVSNGGKKKKKKDGKGDGNGNGKKEVGDQNLNLNQESNSNQERTNEIVESSHQSNLNEISNQTPQLMKVENGLRRSKRKKKEELLMVC